MKWDAMSDAGWVRDVHFHGKQLFSIGCNFIKALSSAEVKVSRGMASLT